MLAGIFGGSEIVKNFEMAADRIGSELKEGSADRGLTWSRRWTARRRRARRTRYCRTAQDGQGHSRTDGGNQGQSGGYRPRDVVPSTNPACQPGRSSWCLPSHHTRRSTQQRGELGNIKNAMATFNSKADAQKAELGNIKNAT